MVRKIADRDSVPSCSCGAVFERIIDKPMVLAEIQPYISPGTGKLVTSRAERAADLKASKAYEWEPGIEKDIARKKQYNVEEAFKPIAEAVDNIVRDMNVCGKLETTNA